MSVELWGLKRKDPPNSERLTHWLEALGSEKLLNRRGTTWRKLEADQQALVETKAGALSLIAEHDALMKRPIWEVSGQVMVGFAKIDQENLHTLLKG